MIINENPANISLINEGLQSHQANIANFVGIGSADGKEWNLVGKKNARGNTFLTW